MKKLPESIALARPRKIPRQQRSIALVNALKDACLQILREEGSEALTVARLAELSGVAVVSIYEYFPNVDAVIAEVFRSVITQIMNRHQALLSAPSRFESLHAYLLNVATNSVLLRREMLRLHPELYVRHIEHFEALAPEIARNPELKSPASIENFARQLEPYRAEIGIGDINRAAFLALRALQMLTRSIAVERRAYLDDPQTPCEIAGMLYGLLTAKSEGSR